MNRNTIETETTGLEIAVIGMAVRFPGAKNIRQFQENLRNGTETIRFFSDEELIDDGITAEAIKRPDYVKAKGYLQEAESFDAGFFGYTPAEAEVMDPQMRLFHEVTWEALENAGYNPSEYDGMIGLYAGASNNLYWQTLAMLSGSAPGLDSFSEWQLVNKDNLTTRISYNLDLKGPSYLLQTACSTSLVAIHVGCQALLSGECGIALAGGVTVSYPRRTGYDYQEGMISSPDGHCRAFDAAARGSVSGEGVGVVALKLLEDAIEDGDHIHAVIKGSAINNDGRSKTGYTAPSIKGQVAVIKAALRMAEVEAESVGCIEAHGTGTILGDPIEMEALMQTFDSDKRQFCGVGSVKSNFGHLDTAAGVAGFVKAVLSLKAKTIFPSLHFKTPNPKTDLSNSPFYVPVEAGDWKNPSRPLRAGISSFGVGGTNAHVIVDEAEPYLEAATETRPRESGQHIIPLSAMTPQALSEARENLLKHLEANPALDLADIAYTLQVGRKHFKHRQIAVCSGIKDALETLSGSRRWVFQAREKNNIVFMFPGIGSQYVDMGRDLYEREPVFRSEMDRCFEILRKLASLHEDKNSYNNIYNLKEILYPSSPGRSGADLSSIEIAQPAIFIFQYALARLLISRGVEPHAMIGYSFGEYTAAAVSGLFSLEDALKIIVTRGKLVQTVTGGTMTSVPLPWEKLEPLLNTSSSDSLSLAIDNGDACIISGPVKQIAALEERMKSERLLCMRVPGASHALHSSAMTPILPQFEACLEKVELNKPPVPYISNVTGGWIREDEALDPRYWSRHLTSTVHFAAGIRELVKLQSAIFLEVGPGRDLAAMVKRYLDENEGQAVFDLVPIPRQPNTNNPSAPSAVNSFLLKRLGYLWAMGVKIDWSSFYTDIKRYRVPLPTYPFQHREYSDKNPRFAVIRKILSGNFDTGLLTAGEQLAPSLLTSQAEQAVQTDILPGTGSKTAPGERPLELDAPYEPPENPIQESMVETWEQFFGIRPIGIRDDFFQLGGDSLKAMNLSNLLRDRLQVEIPVAEFFNRQTPAELARFVEEKVPAKDHRTPQPVEKRDYYPLSPAQKRLYVLQQMDPGGTGYNEQLSAILEGELDMAKLEDTFKKLISRHESLRTSFHMLGETPVQRVHDNVNFQVERKEADSRDFIHSFDLSQAPLFRVTVREMEDNRHLLVLDLHHIISDGTSQSILLDDFMAIYSGEEPAESILQYKDYCMWQQNSAESGQLKQQEDYWLERFSTEIPQLNLPSDFTRPAVLEFAGARTSFTLDPERSEKLLQFASRQGVSLFMVLLAAYNILLSRLGNIDDIVVGTPTAGRRHASFHNIFGMFINTLALRNAPAGSKRIEEFLREVRESTLQAFENQDYQLEELVDRVVIARDMSRNPLFDTMLALQNMDVPGIDIPGLSLKPYEVEHNVTKFDLTLNAFQAGGGIYFNFEYRTCLFKEETIQRFGRYFIEVLTALPGEPARKIEDIELPDQQEKEALLYGFNGTDAQFPLDKTVHGLIREHVRKAPGHRAVVQVESEGGSNGGHESLSYGRLAQKAAQVAEALRQKGVGPGHIAGIMAPLSTDLIAGILGILEAGAAYLPLNPTLPGKRIDYMLADSNAAILLTTRDSAAGTAVEFDKERLYIEDIDQISASSPDTGDLPAHSPAYVIYTSGSTGRPKGVVVRHYSLVNFIHAIQRGFDNGLSASDNFLGLTAISFDVSVAEIFLPLGHGATLTLMPNEEIFDVEKLARILVEQEITFTYLPPSLLPAVSARLAGFRDKLKLERLQVGVEPIPDRVLEDYLALNPKMHILVAYGPTETTICATAGQYRSRKTDGSFVPIGGPLANTRVYITDNKLRPVPIGVSGELLISGYQLAAGYLNDPVKTAEHFIPNPFKDQDADGDSTLSHQLLYRTGDLACWLPDGRIQFKGRLDKQVKIRGYRIEPGEIQNVILKSGDVKSAAVTVRENPDAEKYLCAYIVPGDSFDEANGITSLQQFLGSHLPEYMVPSAIVSMERIPLTSHGKIDFNALPEPAGFGTAEEYTPPRDEVEEKLVNIFRDVLNRGDIQIGINSSFFRLGGHSLKATLLVGKIHKTFDVLLPLTDIFRMPTAAELAVHIKSAGKTAFRAIEPAEEREYYPCSPAQNRLYILYQMDPQSTVYNISSVIVFGERPDTGKMTDALSKVIQRHESLRTSFFMPAGQPCQKIHKDVSFEIELPEPASVTPETFIRPFDLSRAPLFRAGLVEVSEGQYLFMVDMHHIISDGVSTDVLIKDFTAFYDGAELPPLRIQYKDFSQWKRSPARQAVIKEQEQYWLRQFDDDVPVLELPYDFPRPAHQDFKGSVHGFGFEPGLTAALNDLTREHDVTLYMLLTALCSIFLSKAGAQEDVVLGSPTAGRLHTDLEPLIGMFINTLAIRSKPIGTKTFPQYLQEVKQQVLDAFGNQEYPFEDLVEKVAIRRDAGRNPLFDVMLVLQNMDIRALDMPGTAAGSYDMETNVSRFDMTITCAEYSDRIGFSIEYATGLFKGETIECFGRYLGNLAGAVTKNPEQPLYRLSLISPNEKRQILEEFNNTAGHSPSDKTIVQLFGEQVERHPSKTAVKVPSGGTVHSLTYRELDDASHRLAAELVRKGAGSDSIVAIIANRSVEMITGIFAVLKAGAAYMPVDPAYPDERKEFMLADSGTQLLLTTGELAGDVRQTVDSIRKNSIHILYIDQNIDTQSSGSLPVERETITPSDLAYVIYTSGTTGRSKGVLVEHRQLAGLLFNNSFPFPFDEQDCWTVFHSFCFDFSVWEMYGSLLKGGTAVIVPQDIARDPVLFRNLLEEQRITVLNQTPAAFFNLMEQELKQPERNLHLKCIILAGEALNPSKLQAWRQRYPETRLYNMYGITETTIVSTFKELDEDDISRSTNNAGIPLPGQRLYVVDSYMQLQPVGIPGELLVGGGGLARGYLNRPQLTREKYIGDPFNPGGLVYRSGDLVRWLPGGCLECLGRIDRQVKIRGFRIEPGEIENRLIAHALIKEAVVIPKGAGEDVYLCAYFVPAEPGSEPVDTSPVRQTLGRYLPPYMIPAHFVQLEQVPLTANGKVDLRVLPEPEISGGESTAPKNEMEETLLRIWSRVLDIDAQQIGTATDFFRIGGHSLKAIQVVNAVHKAFHVRLPVQTLFQSPTIAELAAEISQMEVTPFSEITSQPGRPYYELSYSQRRLWVIQRRNPGSPLFNMPEVVTLHTPMEIEKLTAAAGLLCKRHGSLRTCFREMDGEIVQVIRPEVDIRVEVVDLSALPVEQMQRERVAAFTAESCTLFDLERAPLLRLKMVKCSETESDLIFTMHHLISDGWSMALLQDEFMQYYNNPGLEKEPLRLEYKDYVVWHNKLLADKDKLQPVMRFWKQQLSGSLPVVDLPYDVSLSMLKSRSSAGYRFRVPEELTHKLRELSVERNAGMFTLLLAGLHLLLSFLRGQEDIILTFPGAARPHEDLKDIIGLFVNTLILRTRMDMDESFDGFLDSMRGDIFKVLEYQAYPMEMICDELGIKYPELSVFFNMQNTGESSRYDLEQFDPYHIEALQDAKFPLVLYVMEYRNGINIMCHYYKELFSPQTIERIIGQYVKVLENIAADPGKPLNSYRSSGKKRKLRRISR